MLKDEELLMVKGGTISLSGPVIEGALKLLDKIYEIGVSIGDSISRLFNRGKCINVKITR